jgi:hypothetical protein
MAKKLKKIKKHIIQELFTKFTKLILSHAIDLQLWYTYVCIKYIKIHII